MEPTCEHCGKGSEYGPVHSFGIHVLAHTGCHMQRMADDLDFGGIDIDMDEYPKYKTLPMAMEDFGFVIVPEDFDQSSIPWGSKNAVKVSITFDQLLEKYNDLVGAINDYNHDIPKEDGSS
jgi:hypothetical protein